MIYDFKKCCPRCNVDWEVIGNDYKWDIFGCSNDCGLQYSEDIFGWVYKKFGIKCIHWPQDDSVECYVEMYEISYTRKPIYLHYLPFDITEEQLDIYLTFS